MRRMAGDRYCRLAASARRHPEQAEKYLVETGAWRACRRVARSSEGSDLVFGQGIMYSFTRPASREWHSPYHSYLLEPTKEVARKALRYHANDPERRLGFITS